MPRNLKQVDLSHNLLNDRVIKAAIKFYKKNQANSLSVIYEGNLITNKGKNRMCALLSFETHQLS